MELWQEEWKERITTRAVLERFLELSPDERAWFSRYEASGGNGEKGEPGESVPVAEKPHTSLSLPSGTGNVAPPDAFAGTAASFTGGIGASGSPGSSAPLLPFALTPSWLDRMGPEADDPLRIQAVPRIGEARQLPCESADPLFEGAYSPLPGLVHRYEDRVLFYGGRQCGLYCRYCFRRHLTGEPETAGGDSAGAGENELVHRSLCDQAREVAGYVKSRREVKELLLSGGDPLTLPDETLSALIGIFRSARPDLIIRIGSRMPVVLPSRLTPSLARLLGSFAPIFMIIQTNHPRELSAEVVEALGRLARSGIPLLNQSVFLRGVNDSEAVLRELSTALLSAGVLPYYLFQGDLAAGTAHLRASMKRGLEIMGGLHQRMSGMATPTYAVDLPGGGGKITLPLEPPPRWEGGFFHIPGPGGRVFRYPDEG